jgi:hypothetical protein
MKINNNYLRIGVAIFGLLLISLLIAHACRKTSKKLPAPADTVRVVKPTALETKYRITFDSLNRLP